MVPPRRATSRKLHLSIRYCENNIKQKRIHWSYIRCSFKFPVKVGVEESIVNAPLVTLQIKNTNIAKSEVRADP
jgi:hypothetical protein